MNDLEKNTDQTLSAMVRRGEIEFGQMRTVNARMADCLEKARIAAATAATVLICGENGTGKNLVAQAIHNASPFREGNCVIVNCGAIPENLIESELFGHVKGAFTGADRDRKGKFELANSGTLILDEIADMPISVQGKILRAVEYKQFESVGDEKSKESDARLIAITNQPLSDLVEKGRFRKDLFFRLNEISLMLPPLRERRDDMGLLMDYFLSEIKNRTKEKIPGFTADAFEFLKCYPWPGNIRELRAVVRSTSLMSKGKPVTREMIIDYLGSYSDALQPRPVERFPRSLEEVEREHVKRVLDWAGGNKKLAAEKLGISRPTLNSKLK